MYDILFVNFFRAAALSIVPSVQQWCIRRCRASALPPCDVQALIYGTIKPLRTRWSVFDLRLSSLDRKMIRCRTYRNEISVLNSAWIAERRQRGHAAV